MVVTVAQLPCMSSTAAILAYRSPATCRKSPVRPARSTAGPAKPTAHLVCQYRRSLQPADLAREAAHPGPQQRGDGAGQRARRRVVDRRGPDERHVLAGEDERV